MLMIDSDDELDLENPASSDSSGSGGVKRKTEGESGMEKSEKKAKTNRATMSVMETEGDDTSVIEYKSEPQKPVKYKRRFLKEDRMYVGYYNGSGSNQVPDKISEPWIACFQAASGVMNDFLKQTPVKPHEAKFFFVNLYNDHTDLPRLDALVDIGGGTVSGYVRHFQAQPPKDILMLRPPPDKSRISDIFNWRWTTQFQVGDALGQIVPFYFDNAFKDQLPTDLYFITHKITTAIVATATRDESKMPVLPPFTDSQWDAVRRHKLYAQLQKTHKMHLWHVDVKRAGFWALADEVNEVEVVARATLVFVDQAAYKKHLQMIGEKIVRAHPIFRRYAAVDIISSISASGDRMGLGLSRFLAGFISSKYNSH
jgi:hypothetical protein